MKKRLIAAIILIISGITTMNPCVLQGQTSQEKPVSRIIEDGGTGPYPALMLTESSLSTHTVFRPQDLSSFGENNKLPVIAWGNGACANSPWEHVNFLSEISSYGFLVIAIGPMPAEGEKGRGRSSSSQFTDAIDWAIAQNSDRTSRILIKLISQK